MYPSDLKTQFVPRSKHFLLLVIKTDKLMLHREIIAVCYEVHAEPIMRCGQNTEFLIVKAGGRVHLKCDGTR
jgi:hypothetical protein